MLQTQADSRAKHAQTVLKNEDLSTRIQAMDRQQREQVAQMGKLKQQLRCRLPLCATMCSCTLNAWLCALTLLALQHLMLALLLVRLVVCTDIVGAAALNACADIGAAG